MELRKKYAAAAQLTKPIFDKNKSLSCEKTAAAKLSKPIFDENKSRSCVKTASFTAAAKLMKPIFDKDKSQSCEEPAKLRVGQRFAQIMRRCAAHLRKMRDKYF